MYRIQEGGRRGSAARSFVALALAFAASGCGSSDNLPREPISGSIEFEGKPLAKGQIQFTPTQSAGVAIQSGAPISNGSYSIGRDVGLVPGEYSVSISSEGAAPSKASKAEVPGEMPGLGPLHAQELIPGKYNAATTLKAEVKKGGPNVFDYKLTK